MWCSGCTERVVRVGEQVGPDGTFVPGHVYVCLDEGEAGDFVIGEFGVGLTDTPGSLNLECEVATPPPVSLSPPPTASPPPPSPSPSPSPPPQGQPLAVAINEVRLQQCMLHRMGNVLAHGSCFAFRFVSTSLAVTMRSTLSCWVPLEGLWRVSLSSSLEMARVTLEPLKPLST